MTPDQSVVDQRVVKALAHPLRSRLLAILNERVASPSELASELDESLGVVAYHIRTLADINAIELVETAQRRGATEHYYRATMRPFFVGRDWTRLPESLRRSISDSTLALIFEDISKAVKSGAFDSRPDRHLSRAPLVVDEQGWNEIGEMLAHLLNRSLEIQAESADRLAKDGAEGFSTKLELMHFPGVPVDAKEPSKEHASAAKGANGGRAKSGSARRRPRARK
jgi:DNA-binding transcriptional ArsR family regulator